jgi:hypothetical protein
MSKITKEVIEIQDAMNNLAVIAGMDIEHPPRIGVVKGLCLVTDEEEFPLGAIQWLSGEGYEVIVKILEATYRAIHHHLLALYENPEMNWENEKTKKGIASMMELVGESANKMDRYLAFWMDRSIPSKLAQGAEFKSLQQFYTQQFLNKLKGVEGSSAWGEQWEENPEAPMLDMAGSGLKDFETVHKDKEYELFYIRNEEGSPYFSPELFRNIKLSIDFESKAESFEEDPLLKVRAMQDRDLHSSAHQILTDCRLSIQDLFKISHKLADNDLAGQLNMCVMALFLAANPRHLLQNTTGKSCLQYFDDFHHFLRKAMNSSTYQKWLAYPPEKNDKAASILLYLTHALCRSFFQRVGGIKQESIGLIYRTMRRGTAVEKKKGAKGETLWNRFLLDDENLRALLAQFPNGPLFKILDLIREEQEEAVPFDPMNQQNLPLQLYQLEGVGKPIDFIKIPSPTRQYVITKVEIVEEFRGFLRALSQEQKKKKHLMINLQDRTSWREYARSRSLENLQKNAEFSSQLFVLTLPKDGDFYHQNNEYLNQNSSDALIKALQMQLKSPEEHGYYFPPSLHDMELGAFAEQVLPAILTHFFHGKNTLTRRNREDFIEIFYQFLILKVMAHLEPHSVSFTCKDAIDTGAAQAAAFYGFLKLFDGGLEKKEDQDFFLWLLYTPALFIRERAIDPERLHRVLSCLERIDAEISDKRSKIFEAFGKIVPLKSLKINHL